MSGMNVKDGLHGALGPGSQGSMGPDKQFPLHLYLPQTSSGSNMPGQPPVSSRKESSDAALSDNDKKGDTIITCQST